MRVRIRLVGGSAVDAEEYSSDGGLTWATIQPHMLLGAMTADGYTIVRDVFTGDWRALNNRAIESVCPSPDLDASVDAEVERRIARTLAGRLPARVMDAAPTVERPAAGPPSGHSPVVGRGSARRHGGQPI